MTDDRKALRDWVAPDIEPSSPYVQTLMNGLHVLELLREGPRTRAEIQHRLGLERSAVYRLLRTLESRGFIVRDGQRGVYQLGLILWELGCVARGGLQVGLSEVVGPRIRALADEFDESVHLSLYSNGEIVYIDKAEGTQPIRSYTHLGGRAPAYCVATGKALLANQPHEEQLRVIKGPLTAYTPHTIVDPDDLLAELQRIRRDGYALNRGEWNVDVGGVGVAIMDLAGSPIAGLGFSGPIDRVIRREHELVEALWATCQDLPGQLATGDDNRRFPVA